MESIATGLLAGINAARLSQRRDAVYPPRETACGSLVHYITSAGTGGFQPANISFGLLPELPADIRKKMKDRKERHRLQVEEALRKMDQWIATL